MRHRKRSRRLFGYCRTVHDPSIPKRPDARRSQNMLNREYRNENNTIEIGKFVMGYGLFPSCFVLNFVFIYEYRVDTR